MFKATGKNCLPHYVRLFCDYSYVIIWQILYILYISVQIYISSMRFIYLNSIKVFYSTVASAYDVFPLTSTASATINNLSLPVNAEKVTSS